MQLTSAKVGPFRSINSPQELPVDPSVTVLVGMNEAGKTVLLRALEKSADALGEAAFDPVEDYPRKDLSAYLKRHSDAPDVATVLTFQPSPDEIEAANKKLGTTLKAGFQFAISHKYDNSRSIDIHVDEKSMVNAFAATLSTDAADALKPCMTLRDIPQALQAASLTETDEVALTALKKRIEAATAAKWDSVGRWEAWSQFSPSVRPLRGGCVAANASAGRPLRELLKDVPRFMILLSLVRSV
jgi:hypothetical protein